MFVKEVEGLEEKANAATLGQVFVGNSAVTFVWSCVPYRGEWRYNITSHKAMLLDAGHVCQNLYIACEAVGSGTCAIAAYDQRLCDELIDVDGTEEFTVYLAPVAKY
jgi:SagB-type dehydrogenase family enzyme